MGRTMPSTTKRGRFIAAVASIGVVTFQWPHLSTFVKVPPTAGRPQQVARSIVASPTTLDLQIDEAAVRGSDYVGLDKDDEAWSERAYELFSETFPEIKERGERFGIPCDRAAVLQSFQVLSDRLGGELAFEAIQLEPILLVWGTDTLQSTGNHLDEMAGPGQEAAVSDLIRMNPGVLTIPVVEFGRTGDTIESLTRAAHAIGVVRSMGSFGGVFIIMFVVGMTIVVTKGFAFLERTFEPQIDGVLHIPAVQAALDMLPQRVVVGGVH